jgi:hypothetical protein
VVLLPRGATSFDANHTCCSTAGSSAALMERHPAAQLNGRLVNRNRGVDACHRGSCSTEQKGSTGCMM